MIPKVPIYMNADDEWNISSLYSFLAWREHYNGTLDSVTIPRAKHGLCTFCDNHRIAKLDDYGYLRCICDIKEEEKKLPIKLGPYRSKHKRTKLSELKIWGKPMERGPSVKQQEDSLVNAIDVFQKWEKYPDKWITVHGKVGCGKTHMLTSLATTYGSWALYMTVADFEHRIFEALDNDDLNNMLDAIKRAPILLLDDLGADYGSKFPKSNLRKVIDFRYMRPIEYPTVVASNLNRKLTMDYDMRIGDRIYDKNNTHILHITAPSWRTMHDTENHNVR